MSYVKRILTATSRRLLDTNTQVDDTNNTYVRQAHKLWDIHASDGKYTIKKKLGEDDERDESDDKRDESDDERDESDTAIEVSEVSMGEVVGPTPFNFGMPLPESPSDLLGKIKPGDMVVFVVGAREFSGSVLRVQGRKAMVQTGGRRYWVHQNWLYKAAVRHANAPQPPDGSTQQPGLAKSVKDTHLDSLSQESKDIYNSQPVTPPTRYKTTEELADQMATSRPPTVGEDVEPAGRVDARPTPPGVRHENVSQEAYSTNPSDMTKR